jgi:hypothetical protein
MTAFPFIRAAKGPIAAACALLIGSAAPTATVPRHRPAFWRDVAKAGFSPPASADVPGLAAELCDMLASPDPELRDTIAYSTLASWIYQQKLLDATALQPLARTLIGNLRAGIGSVGSDAVFRRSFSALVLSVVVARDNMDPVLTDNAHRQLLDAALQYLAAEHDVRGYDESKGWMHSAAHTADLLKFLARSRYLAPTDQTRLLDAIAHKLKGSPVFTFGEDERFARAVLSVIKRPDFDRNAFAGWIAASKPAAARDDRPKTIDLQAAQNIKNLLAKLEVLLSVDPQPSDSVRAARDDVRNALNDAF